MNALSRWGRFVWHRMGRGKWVFVRQRGKNANSAELDPEATRSTDQTLTEISLGSANSDSNASILREYEKATDRLKHIQSGLPAKHSDVLTKALDLVELGDSLREIARKTGLHAPQVIRAFEAAKKADKQQISKRANREKRSVAYKPYNPRVVPMDTIMMPHQGPILYNITVPTRRIGDISPVHKMPPCDTSAALDLSEVQSESQTTRTESPTSSGPEPKSHAVFWPAGPEARSLPSSPRIESKFGKLKQLFSSCFQWFRTQLTALTGLKHPVSRGESIRAKASAPGT